MLRRHRSAGTTLIEVLVAIVVLLVGILAVVQIFPGGFRVMTWTRNNTMATQMARDEVERLQVRADTLPEMILPIRYEIVSGAPVAVVDENRQSRDLGPVANDLGADGNLYVDGVSIGEWPMRSGPNVFRRVINERLPIAAPRQFAPGTFGSLAIINFGPAERLISVKGPDLVQMSGTPGETVRPYEYWFDTTAMPTLFFGQRGAPFQVLLSLTAWIDVAGTPERRTYRDILLTVPAGAGIYSLPLSGDATNPDPLELGPGETIAGVESSLPVRVAVAFRQIGTGDSFSSDPFEFKVLDPILGVLLFSPASYNYVLPTQQGRLPLTARISYDVRDWRILREDHRLIDNAPTRFQLAVGSLKVGNDAGPDGRPNQGLFGTENVAVTNDARADHFVLLDLDTGGLYYERWNGQPAITINKSNGRVTVLDVNPGVPGTQAVIRLPDGTDVPVNVEGRAVRALYMAKDEWAVQALKPPALYSVVRQRPTTAEVYVGGSGGLGGSPTRIYFPPADAGRMVTVGQINYRRAGESEVRSLLNQSFVVRNTPPDGAVGLPYIDLTDADELASTIDFSYGFGVRNVEGASVAVRAMWNPSRFTLTNDPATNISRLELWLRDWRRQRTETTLGEGQ